jgi:hypothetical protein
VVSREAVLATLAKLKTELRDEYGIKELGLFGSFARGEATAESDMDVLVEFARPIGFFKFLELEERLSEALGHKVDLVPKKALKPHIGASILAEVLIV